MSLTAISSLELTRKKFFHEPEPSVRQNKTFHVDPKLEIKAEMCLTAISLLDHEKKIFSSTHIIGRK